MYLLNKQKVDPAWTWDQTMRGESFDASFVF